MHNAHESTVEFNGSQTYHVCVSQFHFVSIFCIYFLDLKGLNGTYGRTQKDTMLSNFFKFSKNPNDISPLVIPPKHKLIPFFATSSTGNKVKSNYDFNLQ